MSDEGPDFWPVVRPFCHEIFRFWPDGEDLIWAKSIWPVLQDAGLFSDQSDEALAWTHRNLLALALLYAQSAEQFGTPDFQRPSHLDEHWLLIAFGSEQNRNDALSEVGLAINAHFPRTLSGEGDPEFLLPLIRSLATGSGAYREGAALENYLHKVAARGFEMTAFREDRLRRMWVGGNFRPEDCC